ncbi:solute carrier family 35 member E2A-like [Watersipora subatra]|uniref:solute carrier family 35 member E2A-like n=1 Tax=Watersipora subatra TaxID=2589382 RepID=UPI00355B3ECD
MLEAVDGLESSDASSEQTAMVKERLDTPNLSENKLGIRHPKAMLFLVLWYIFSTLTLFLNKYIVDIQQGDAGLLGVCQMVMITLGGAFNMYVMPCGLHTTSSKSRQKPPNFYRNMVVIGGFRFLTVLLGLIALKHVAVSFTETVKSSAPMFTVLIARVMLGESTSVMVLCSLIPIMGGLALTSRYELSFNFTGLLAALGTNISECIQNVYSKMLFNAADYEHTPAEMQFYTSACSMVVQIPIGIYLINIENVRRTMSWTMAVSLLLNGIFFHGQTITAYGLMGYISPVTHSVANTVKRALMIWLSVLVFGNPVTLLSGVGMVLVTIGVFIYNKARERESNSAQTVESTGKYP